MSDKVYFIRCTRPERFNLIFRIISYDASTKRGVLQGQYAPFEHDLSKEHLKVINYKVVTADQLNAEGISYAKQRELCSGLQTRAQNSKKERGLREQASERESSEDYD